MTTSTPPLNDQISDTQLSKYAKLIYEITGICISPQKKALLSNRLRRRLKVTKIKNFDEYYRLLKKLKADDPEWDAFLQEITTHETFLFRDAQHWDWFQDTYLKDIAAEAAAGNRPKTLRIWSAACSTGDEAYTLASCIAGSLPNVSSWKINILGTDIGVGAVQQAKEAVFGLRAMRLVPEDLKKRFFKKIDNEDKWEAKPALTQMVEFRQHNLLEPLRDMPFDLIFVKNVLIYFDAGSKKTAIELILDKLADKGMLVSGAAEGISEFLKPLARIQPWLSQKK